MKLTLDFLALYVVQFLIPDFLMCALPIKYCTVAFVATSTVAFLLLDKTYRISYGKRVQANR